MEDPAIHFLTFGQYVKIIYLQCVQTTFLNILEKLLSKRDTCCSETPMESKIAIANNCFAFYLACLHQNLCQP